MSKLRQGDILLFQTNDGGEIKSVNGEPEMDGGMESAVYISIFGSDGKAHWMEEYQEENEKTRSEFINFIEGNQKTLANINRAASLLEKDLDWFKSSGIVDIIDISFEDVNVNRSKVIIEMQKNGETVSDTEFEINWIFQKENPGSARI
jgi:phage gp46-like protein